MSTRGAKMSHTEGRLLYEPPEDGLGATLSVDTGEIICVAEYDDCKDDPARREHDMQLLADCWNACEGIDPEAVTDMREALEKLADAVDAVATASYCELCDRHAPKNETGMLEGNVPHAADCPLIEARAALEKAKP